MHAHPRTYKIRMENDSSVVVIPANGYKYRALISGSTLRVEVVELGSDCTITLKNASPDSS